MTLLTEVVGSVIKDYKVVREMRQGAQGFVCVVMDVKDENQYILKALSLEESKKAEFGEMIEMWKIFCKSRARSSFVTYKEHFFENKKAVMVMEYCSNGDLETLIKKKILENERFSEEEVLKLLIEVVDGLKEMHVLKFIHRDIKSANILIDASGRFKICDFNTSKILEGCGGSQTMVGTLEFTAPEIVNSEQYDSSVDIFSFGAVLYQVMVLKTPFINERGGVVMKNLMVGKFEPISPSLGYSQPLIQLVHSCLSVDPTHRPPAAAIADLPFLTAARVTLRITQMEQKMVEMQERVRKSEMEIQERLRKSESLLDRVYPVGSIYISTTAAAEPSQLLGGGSWVRWGQGKVPVSVDTADTDFSTPEKTGGNKRINIAHRHEEGDLVACIGSPNGDASRLGFAHANPWSPSGSQTPNCTYRVGGSFLGGDNVPFSHFTRVVGYTNTKLDAAQSVMNPYITCYMWKRTG